MQLVCEHYMFQISVNKFIYKCLKLHCRDSSLSILMAKGWRTKESGFDFWQGQEIFLFSTASRLAMGLTQPPIQRVPDSLSQGVKLTRHEVDHPSSFFAEAKNAWSMPHSHSMS
jgi:hypothetical protein